MGSTEQNYKLSLEPGGLYDWLARRDLWSQWVKASRKRKSLVLLLAQNFLSLTCHRPTIYNSRKQTAHWEKNSASASSNTEAESGWNVLELVH